MINGQSLEWLVLLPPVVLVAACHEPTVASMPALVRGVEVKQWRDLERKSTETDLLFFLTVDSEVPGGDRTHMHAALRWTRSRDEITGMSSVCSSEGSAMASGTRCVARFLLHRDPTSEFSSEGIKERIAAGGALEVRLLIEHEGVLSFTDWASTKVVSAALVQQLAALKAK